MQDNYITIKETALLISWLVGPEIFIGIAGQIICFYLKGIFQSGGALSAYIVIVGSSLVVVVLSVLIWIMFPQLAPDVLAGDGFSRMPFVPAVISALIVYPFFALLIIRTVNKK